MSYINYYEQDDNIQTYKPSKLLLIFYLCLPLVGLVPSAIVSIPLMIIMAILFIGDEFYYLYPATIVYYSYLYVPFTSLSLYRFYSLLLLIKLLVHFSSKIKIRPQFVTLAVLLLYMLMAVMFVNVRTAVFGIVDILVIYLLVTCVMEDENSHHLDKMIGALAVACAFSIITGLTSGNSISLSYELSGSWRATIRFCGTFPDPNYCSFIFILAICGLLSTRSFSKALNTILIIILGIGIAMTISFTGYIGLFVSVMFYLILTKKINLKTIFVIMLLCIGMIGMYFYGSIHTDAPIVGDIVYRINSYILNYETSSNGGLAVSRITIYKEILEKFQNQSVIKQLFGMNTEVPIFTQSTILVAHNDYVDVLYNLGAILTVIFYAEIIYRFFHSVLNYHRSNDERYAFVATTKVIWLYYSLVLTMLTERIFYMCLFI